MRAAARWADAANVNVALTSADDVRGIDAKVRVACKAEGRDCRTLDLTGWARLSLAGDGRAVERPGFIPGTPEEVGATVRAFVDAGLSHLTFWVGSDDDDGWLPVLTPEVLSRFSTTFDAIRLLTEA